LVKEDEVTYNVDADFLNAAHINEIGVDRYPGQPDSDSQVCAVDDFELKEVTISIHDSDGTLFYIRTLLILLS